MTPRALAGGRAGEDRGAVTAETAVVLPVLVLVVAFGCWLLAVGLATVRCTDAARLGARAAARGDTPSSVAAITRGAAPAGAGVDIQRRGDTVRVSVHVSVHPLGGWIGRLGAVGVSAAATAPAEEAAGTPGLGR